MTHDPSSIRLRHSQAWIPQQPDVGGLQVLGEAVTALTYKAVTVPAYKMVGTSFPVIMPDPSGKPVAGKIYTVDDATLARLDQLEREGRSYDRVMIDATLPLSNGERLTTQAFIYVGREERFGEMFARGRSTSWRMSEASSIGGLADPFLLRLNGTPVGHDRGADCN